MFEFMRAHQLNIMLCCTAVCNIIAVFICLSRAIGKKRKINLFMLSVSAGFLLEFDRAAYHFRGMETVSGYWWVRISNFMVYALSLYLLYAFNKYLMDLIVHEGGMDHIPRRLIFVKYLVIFGELMLVLSQITGFYYSFDEHNRYERGPGFILCYMVPLIVFVILLTGVIKYTKKVNKYLRISLFTFVLIPMLASGIQLFTYGISLTNISLVLMVIVLYLFVLFDSNAALERANAIEIGHLKEQQKNILDLFEQTATAFVGAIDAKDKYTKGHSQRVAKYAKTIAEFSGKNEEECQNVYYAALLHEVGKIGVSDSILSKETALSEEEYAQLKQYPAIGRDILSSIKAFPFLSEAAYYHHERYDGTGYPEGLKGEEIPELARIISVADAYDTMTSQRSYRDPIPQQKVREEFVKGMGTQFDPEFAKIMLHMIDLDSEYTMQEKVEITEFTEQTEIECEEYRSSVSEGVALTPRMVKIGFTCTPKKSKPEDICMPALVVFDSLDSRVHTTLREIDNLNYFEYAEMWFDGHAICSGARNLKSVVNVEPDMDAQKDIFDRQESIDYELQAVKYRDHALFRLISKYETMEVILALPDNSRFAYVAFTGEHCHIGNVHISHEEEEIDENYIPRIAEEVSYINRLQGDIPNIQVDGYRTDATEGVEVKDGMEIYFHGMSLPTARLVWHCPFINLFYSDDKKPMGENYHEYALIRLDGEAWEEGEFSSNRMNMKKEADFSGWEDWKEKAKEGIEVTVTLRRSGNHITTITRNNGISIKNVTTIHEDVKNVYVSLTGDQVALTDIRFRG